MQARPLRIEMFGRLRIAKPQSDLAHFRTAKSAELLARLALFPAGDTREALADLLWPEADTTTGRNRLKQEICSLRRMLEERAEPDGRLIDADRATVSLRPSYYSTDVAEFRSLVNAAGRMEDLAQRAALLETAAAINSTELLAGLHSSWIALERESLNAERAELLLRLAHCYVSLGRGSEAETCLAKAIEIDPQSELPLLALMEALKSRGEPREAVRRFRAWQLFGKENRFLPPSRRAWDLARACAGETQRPSEVSPTDRLGVHVQRAEADYLDIEEVGAGPVELRQPRFSLDIPSFDGELFGFEEQIEALCRTMADAEGCAAPLAQTYQTYRLLTLTGPRGCGKTRMGLAAAQRLADELGWQPFYMNLADFVNGRDFRIALEATARLLRAAAGDRTGKPLLILDGWDLGPPDMLAGVEELFRPAAGPTVLATSLHPIGVGHERIIGVLPLELPMDHEGEPPGAEATAVDRIARVASVCMFVERARMHRPDFQLTDRNVETIAAICRVLGGLPLAIELAAARVNGFSPSQMLHQLRERPLDFLVSTRRNIPARHRNMCYAAALASDSHSALAGRAR
jgi:DNA-binding SARP family transcriptional activator